MNRRVVFGIISPAIALMILLGSLSWLFGRISVLRNQALLQVQVPVTVENKPVSEEKVDKPSHDAKKVAESEDNHESIESREQEVIRQKPKIQKRLTKNSLPAGKKTQQTAYASKGPQRGTIGPTGETEIPAISIYYGYANIHEYMRALASKGCIFLIKSALGKMFARYDPLSGEVTSSIPADLTGYSPRSRLLAIYGENPLADRIIEEGTRVSPTVSFPDDCKLIALLSRGWEDTLFKSVSSAAAGKGIALKDIESAEAIFYANRLFLNRIRIRGGIQVDVNRPVPSLSN
jgi:hypothetical protein